MLKTSYHMLSIDDLVSASEDDLRNYTWCLGLILEKFDPPAKVDFLNLLLKKILRLPYNARCWCTENLVNYIEEMSPDTQKLLVNTMIGMVDSVTLRDIDICDTFSRIFHKVGMPAKKLISCYIEACEPAPNKEILYRKIVSIISLEQASNTSTTGNS